MKEYSYKGYNFRATNVMTEVHRTIPGNGYRYTALCPLYEIDGLKEEIQALREGKNQEEPADNPSREGNP